MTLEQALKILAKTPVQARKIDEDVIFPAMIYNQKVENAITWLVNRYNDGSLDIVGETKPDEPLTETRYGNVRAYVMRPIDKVKKKRKVQYVHPRGYGEMVKTYGKDVLKNNRYIALKDFAQISPLSYRQIFIIAEKSNALIKVEHTKGTHFYYVDTDAFYGYLEAIRNNTDVYVNITEACRLTGFTAKMIRTRIKNGQIKVNNDLKGDLKDRNLIIYRSSLYMHESFAPDYTKYTPKNIEKIRKELFENGKNNNSSK